ncbi:type II toxin-antitoxin system YafQ family toxin [Candidatus Neptunochlamydia vexilliferae]|uniref:mRNA interferase YafQ n=1 Tax=Candidatus Neptunichlamydia vexilliferae TaxID=1651774 RepID=A0ABS0B0H2_9BACT|nr:type II toxin-antitoxin system YafQ family toxin [Candidatus Neptunochlamydia vexilliferae]MBF5059885.1 mRNA interferase YafQ [Candidatus Neptunochlamydia vexilliferae]
MKKTKTTNQFNKDLKKMKKRGKDLRKVRHIISLLTHAERLPAKCRDHKLTGNFRDHWECHIEPDWLLIYRKSQDEVVLVETGTHSDLFKKTIHQR